MLTQLKRYSQDKQFFVFDFDRTLAKMEIDWSGWHIQLANLFDKYDSHLDVNQKPIPHSWHYRNQLVEIYGDNLLNEIREMTTNYESKFLNALTPNTELVNFIQTTNFLTFYVYSSNSKKTVITGISELGLLEYIRAVVSLDDVRFIKPNPEGFYLFDNFEQKKSQFLMIGDSEADQKAAQAAGIDFVECKTFEE